MPSSCQQPSAVLLMVAVRHRHVVLHTEHRSAHTGTPPTDAIQPRTHQANKPVRAESTAEPHKHTTTYRNMFAQVALYTAPKVHCTTTPCTYCVPAQRPAGASRADVLTYLAPQVGCFVPPQNDKLVTPASCTTTLCYRLPIHDSGGAATAHLRKCSRLSPALASHTQRTIALGAPTVLVTQPPAPQPHRPPFL